MMDLEEEEILLQDLNVICCFKLNNFFKSDFIINTSQNCQYWRKN